MTFREHGVFHVFNGASWAGFCFIVMTVSQLGCSRAPAPKTDLSFELKSASFSGEAILKAFTCEGQDTSPELSWKSPPERTQSFALIVIDKDSRFGSVVGYFLRWVLGYFAHWVVYDIPADKRELPEGTAKVGQLPDGSRQGQNDFDKTGYGGPCPPGSSSHHYVFTLYALDTKLNLSPGASMEQVLKAMNGHVLATGELMGRYPH
jgi:Raf kinase inhibitor-like YbhB/YbcL family protein